MKKFNQILLAISLFALASIVSAVPITGTIEFDGGYTTDTGDKNTATIFTFLNPINVTAAGGSFAPLSGGTVTYNALDLNNIPVSPLWSATVASVDYSFELNNIIFDQNVGTFRLIEGTGMFTVGSDTQFGNWAFSTQGSGSGGTFSFSASQAPEPAILGLLGLGLLGIGATRKFRKI